MEGEAKEEDQPTTQLHNAAVTPAAQVAPRTLASMSTPSPACDKGSSKTVAREVVALAKAEPIAQVRKTPQNSASYI